MKDYSTRMNEGPVLVVDTFHIRFFCFVYTIRNKHFLRFKDLLEFKTVKLYPDKSLNEKISKP
jgi:hypothetical protein